MATPTVYSWLDIGAPQRRQGEPLAKLEAIFRACLIDGYGNKLPPGTGVNRWSIPFSNERGFILKQGGTPERKCCMKIYDLDETYGFSFLTAAATDYIDFDTPVEPFVHEFTSRKNSCGYGNDNYVIPWVIIATERSMYCFFGHNRMAESMDNPTVLDYNGSVNFYCAHFFFGDYLAHGDSLRVNQMLTYCNTGSTGNFHYFCYNFVTYDITGVGAKKLAGNFANMAVPLDAVVMTARATSHGLRDMGALSVHEFSPIYPNAIDGALYLDVVRLVADQTIMGEFPGMLYSLQGRVFEMTHNHLVIDGVGEYEGEKLYVFSSHVGAVFFIRIGEWGVE